MNKYLLTLASVGLLGLNAFGATETLARFNGFSSESLTQNGYTLNLNENTIAENGTITIGSSPILFTRSSELTNTSTDGLTLIVRYSSQHTTSERTLVSATYNGSSFWAMETMNISGKMRLRIGTENGSYYTAGDANRAPSEGYLIWTVDSSSGHKFYSATGDSLWTQSNGKPSAGVAIGETIGVGGVSGQTSWIAGSMVVKGLEVRKGILASNDIPYAIVEFEGRAQVYEESPVLASTINAAADGKEGEIYVTLPADATLTLNETLTHTIKLLGSGDVTLTIPENASTPSSEALAKINADDLTGELHYGWGHEYVIEVSETTSDWDGIDWDNNAQTTIQPTSQDTVTLKVSGDATVNLATAVTVRKLIVEYKDGVTAGTLKLAGAVSFTAQETMVHAPIDVSGLTTSPSLGTVTITDKQVLVIKDDKENKPYTTVVGGIVKQIAPTGTVTTTADYKTMLSPTAETGAAGVAVDPQGGEIEVTGKYTNFAVSCTDVETALKFTNVNIDCGEANNLTFGKANVTIAGDTTKITTSRYITSQQQANRPTRVEQTGGVIHVTSAAAGNAGSGNSVGNQAALLLGHFPNGDTTYNLFGGSLLVPKGGLRLGQSSTATLTIQNATFQVHDIYSSQSNSSLNIGAGGILKLGAGGIPKEQHFGFSLNGGTLTTFANEGETDVNVTVGKSISLSDASTLAAATGTTLTMATPLSGSAALTIGTATDTGMVVLEDLSLYSGNLSVTTGTTLKLEGDGLSSSPTITLAEGAMLHVVTESKAHPVTLKVNGLKEDKSNLTVTVAGSTEVINVDVTTNEDGTITIVGALPVLTATEDCTFDDVSNWSTAEVPTSGDIVVDVTDATAEHVTITVNGQYTNYGTIYLRGAGKSMSFIMGATGDVVGVLDVTKVHIEDKTTLALDGTAERYTAENPFTYTTPMEGLGGVSIKGYVKLTGANTYEGGTLVDENAILTIGNASALGRGSLSGLGTVYVNTYSYLPITAANSKFDDTTWQGTLYLDAAAARGNRLYPHLYGNSGSKIVFKNVAGYIQDTTPISATVKLVDGGDTETTNFGLQLDNGSSGGTQSVTFNKLIGEGTFKGPTTSNFGYLIQIKDLSDFNGSLDINQGKTNDAGNMAKDIAISIGDSAASDTNKGKILILSGKTVRIAKDKAWTTIGGLEVTGILGGTGSVGNSAVSRSGNVLFNNESTLDAHLSTDMEHLTVTGNVTWPTGDGVVKFRVPESVLTEKSVTILTATGTCELPANYEIYLGDSEQRVDLTLVAETVEGGTALKVCGVNGAPLVKFAFDNADSLYANTGILGTEVATPSGSAFIRTTVKDSRGVMRNAVQKEANTAQVTLPLTGIKLQNSTLSFWATKSSRVGDDGWDDSHRVTYAFNNTERYQYWEINSAGDKVNVYKSNMPGVNDISMTDDNLHHWVIVTDGTSQTFYVDGVAVPSVLAVENLDAASVYKNIILGWANAGHGAGACAFADIRIYNNAFDAEAVNALYWEGIMRYEADLSEGTSYTWSNLPWKNGITGTPTASDYVTLNVTGAVTVDVGETAVTALKLIANPATGGSLTLSGAGLTTAKAELNVPTNVSGLTTATLGTVTLAANTTLTMNAGSATLTGVGNSTLVKTGAEQADVTLSTTSSPANYTVNEGTLHLANETSAYASGGGGSFGATPNFTVAKDAKLILKAHDIIGWTRGNTVTVAEVAGELNLIRVGENEEDQNETFSGRILLKDGGVINNGKNAGKFLLHNSAIIAVEAGATATLKGNSITANNGTPALEVGEEATLNVASNLARNVALKKTGAGTVVVSSTISDNKALTIEDGTVQLAEAGSITGGTVTIQEAGVFVFINTTAKTFERDMSGAGTIRLSGSEPVTFTGNLGGFTGTIEGGTIEGGVIALAQGGTLNLGRANLGTGVTFALAEDATSTLILPAGQEAGLTIPTGVTLKLALTTAQLIEGYTPATNLLDVTYGTVADNGTFTEITEADGTVNATTGAYTPVAAKWTNAADDGSWNTAGNWTLNGTALTDVPNNKNVEFLDLDDKTSETVTLSAAVTPKSILVDNTTTDYTIGSESHAIQGNHPIIKRGTGALTLKGPHGSNNPGTRISELIVEGGTVTLANDYALVHLESGNNTPFGAKLTVKGGTLDMKNTCAWDTGHQWWLTERTITMGGAATQAVIQNAQIVPYTGSDTAMDFIVYEGTYLEGGVEKKSPAATFAASLANVYTNSSRTRNVVVGKGAGTDYDLIITGDLGTGGQYSDTRLIKKGEGTLQIAGNNTLPKLTIETGTVKVGKVEALSATTTIGADGTLDLNGFDLESGATLRGTGTLTNTSKKTVSITKPLLQSFLDGGGTIAPDANIEVIEMGPELTWMAFGDSITEGQKSGASEIVSYRYELWQLLSKAGYTIKSVGLRNVTIDKMQTTDAWSYHNAWYGATVMPIRCLDNSGSSTSLYYNLDTCLEAGGYPDIITVMIGTNDAANPNNRKTTTTKDDVPDRFNEWVVFMDRMATLRPHSQIFVTTPPKNNGNNPSNLIEEYGNKIREAYQKNAEPFKSHKNLHFVDMWEMKSSDEDTDPGPALERDSDYVGGTDWTHPNASGCKKIAAVWAEAIKAVIGTKGELLKATGEKGELVPVEVFNPTETTIQVRFNKPLKAEQGSAEHPLSATLSGEGVSGVTLTQAMSDARTITFTATGTLPVLTPLTITVKNATALDGSTSDASFAFTAYGSGAAANIPADYRDGFKHRKTLKIEDNNPDYSNGIPYTEDEGDTTQIGNPGHVAYYMELQREGKPVQFVWVSMSAFDTNEAKLYVPTTETGNHQQEVSDLVVYANRGNIITNTTTTATTGIIEFTPYTYTEADDDFTTIPDMFTHEARFGWRDTLAESGTLKGSMQVAQIIKSETTSSSPLWANAQILFALNGFYGTGTDSQMDIGIGSFNTTWTSGAVAQTGTFDWTNVTKSGIEGVQPGAYKVKKLEIWVKPVATWEGTVDGSWDNPENWSPANVPNQAEKVEVILSDSAPHTLTLTTGTYNWFFTGEGKLAIAVDAKATLPNDASLSNGDLERFIAPPGYKVMRQGDVYSNRRKGFMLMVK